MIVCIRKPHLINHKVCPLLIDYNTFVITQSDFKKNDQPRKQTRGFER